MSRPEIIQLKNITYAYPDGRPALLDINLSLFQGEKVALIGPNGAGKSTLLLHLNGLLHQKGDVLISGQKIHSGNLKRVKSQIGLVFQNPDDQLFSPTVFEDVAFGPLNLGWPEACVRESVTRALAAVGLIGFEKRPPHHLSLGEKRRAAIATVLSMDPQVLIFDEPSSNLDPRGRWALIQLLRGLTVTLVVASHDLDLVGRVCERTVLLDQGRIKADRPTPDILQDRNLLRDCGLAPE
jgi:cobalt/nickel transport system ATP-binding protein